MRQKLRAGWLISKPTRHLEQHVSPPSSLQIRHAPCAHHDRLTAASWVATVKIYTFKLPSRASRAEGYVCRPPLSQACLSYTVSPLCPASLENESYLSPAAVVLRGRAQRTGQQQRDGRSGIKTRAFAMAPTSRDSNARPVPFMSRSKGDF